VSGEHEYLPPHQPNCFGCGPANPASIGIRTWRDGKQIRGEARFDRRHEGAPGYAHGGAVTTALDDALGFVLMIIGRPAVTAKLEIDFRSPALLDRTLSLQARLERSDGRKLHLTASLSDDNATIAEARALFLEVPIDHFAPQAKELWAQEHRE
jgi:acyl-coenzyme A thioesterase PaaI-like protein